jgi:hypothetical protein
MMRKERKIIAINDGQSAESPLATSNVSKDGLTSSLTMSCHGVIIGLVLPSATNWNRSVSRYARMAARMSQSFRFSESGSTSCGRSAQEDVAI